MTELPDTASEKPQQGQDRPAMPTPGEGRVLVLRDYCTNLKGSDCRRCSLACPHDAIGYTDEGLPVIDQGLCTRCGICFGICDAFSSNRVTLLDLHERVKRIARRGDPVYFTCQENIFPGFEPAGNVIVLPCLACLPPEFWTLVLTENIQVVAAFDLGYCTDCERSGDIAEMLYTHAIETAEEWAGRKIRFSDTIPEKEGLIKDLTDPEGVDRRSAFTNLVGDVGDIASGKRRLRNSEVLQQFLERRERSRAIAQLNLTEEDELNDFAPLGRTKKTMIPKRRMLLEALARDPQIASRIPLFIARIDPCLCTNELDCCDACPTGALYPDPDTGDLVLEKRYCIGCGLCVARCPNAAIEVVEATAAELALEPADDDTPA